ncbi:MAG TPA: substrate-binding domain-containing protein, partial [Arenicellales bacterium]|nr:substrate-binding domain-containing protein [Arenicellales bacterium]
MTLSRYLILFSVACLLAAVNPASAAAETIRVATASNFTTTLARIAERFRQGSGHQVVLVPGSTGKHYAQIR